MQDATNGFAVVRAGVNGFRRRPFTVSGTTITLGSQENITNQHGGDFYLEANGYHSRDISSQPSSYYFGYINQSGTHDIRNYLSTPSAIGSQGRINGSGTSEQLSGVAVMAPNKVLVHTSTREIGINSLSTTRGSLFPNETTVLDPINSVQYATPNYIIAGGQPSGTFSLLVADFNDTGFVYEYPNSQTQTISGLRNSGSTLVRVNDDAYIVFHITTSNEYRAVGVTIDPVTNVITEGTPVTIATGVSSALELSARGFSGDANIFSPQDNIGVVIHSSGEVITAQIDPNTAAILNSTYSGPQPGALTYDLTGPRFGSHAKAYALDADRVITAQWSGSNSYLQVLQI